MKWKQIIKDMYIKSIWDNMRDKVIEWQTGKESYITCFVV